jgi:hypothetical protein
MVWDSNTTPLVARLGTVTADRLISQRPSYVKAILIHIKGNLNAVACTACQPAATGNGEFRHYAGCVSRTSSSTSLLPLLTYFRTQYLAGTLMPALTASTMTMLPRALSVRARVARQALRTMTGRTSMVVVAVIAMTALALLAAMTAGSSLRLPPALVCVPTVARVRPRSNARTTPNY